MTLDVRCASGHRVTWHLEHSKQGSNSGATVHVVLRISFFRGVKPPMHGRERHPDSHASCQSVATSSKARRRASSSAQAAGSSKLQ
jgi:hypothetical protein